MTGQKLRKFREFRNYSQEYIAEKLGITQNAYSRIETNQTKLTADRLRQLSEILDIPVSDLISDAELQINCRNAAREGIGKELFDFSRRLYDQVISTKDEKIASLEDEICNLRKDRDKMMYLIERLANGSLGGIL
jgi:transcriptional regulator with XRE-family HTH domain